MKTNKIFTKKNIALMAVTPIITVGLALAPFASAAQHQNNHMDDSINIEEVTKGIISDKEWESLSMKQVDVKLKAAGKKMIGDAKDPLYNLTPAQVDKLSEKEWEAIDKKYVNLYGEDFLNDMLDTDEEDEADDTLEYTKGIISDQDWDNLSMSQIDAKLKAAGKKGIGDAKDPLYTKTDTQIDKLTEKEWEAVEKKYKEIYGDDFLEDMGDEYEDYEDMEDSDEEEFEDEQAFLEHVKGVISEADLDKLSMEQIDAKLKKAGKGTLGDTKDPYYKMTPEQMDKLTDIQIEKLEEHYEKEEDEEDEA